MSLNATSISVNSVFSFPHETFRVLTAITFSQIALASRVLFFLPLYLSCVPDSKLSVLFEQFHRGKIGWIEAKATEKNNECKLINLHRFKSHRRSSNRQSKLRMTFNYTDWMDWRIERTVYWAFWLHKPKDEPWEPNKLMRITQRQTTLLPKKAQYYIKPIRSKPVNENLNEKATAQ